MDKLYIIHSKAPVFKLLTALGRADSILEQGYRPGA